jgi:hypothetical protein
MFSPKSLGIASAADAAGFCLGNYAPIIEAYGNAAIASYSLSGFPIAALFVGKSLKPSAHIRFASEDRRAAKIAEWKANIDAAAEYKAKRKAEKAEAKANFVNPLKVGDVLVESWGYEQTNIDFYKVIAVGPKSVKIQKCGSKYVSQNGPAGNQVVADGPGYGEIMTKIVRPGGSVKMSSYSSAYPWDGKPRYETDSMYGH